MENDLKHDDLIRRSDVIFPDGYRPDINGELSDFQCGYNTALSKMKTRLYNVPAVDAVEVVRCRECKHWSIPDDSYGWCSEWENTVENPDCYCACGKRREDGDT